MGGVTICKTFHFSRSLTLKKIYCGTGTSFTLHLLMNLHYIEENKIKRLMLVMVHDGTVHKTYETGLLGTVPQN